MSDIIDAENENEILNKNTGEKLVNIAAHELEPEEPQGFLDKESEQLQRNTSNLRNNTSALKIDTEIRKENLQTYDIAIEKLEELTKVYERLRDINGKKEINNILEDIESIDKQMASLPVQYIVELQQNKDLINSGAVKSYRYGKIDPSSNPGAYNYRPEYGGSRPNSERDGVTGRIESNGYWTEDKEIIKGGFSNRDSRYITGWRVPNPEKTLTIDNNGHSWKNLSNPGFGKDKDEFYFLVGKVKELEGQIDKLFNRNVKTQQEILQYDKDTVLLSKEVEKILGRIIEINKNPNDIRSFSRGVFDNYNIYYLNSKSRQLFEQIVGKDSSGNKIPAVGVPKYTDEMSVAGYRNGYDVVDFRNVHDFGTVSNQQSVKNEVVFDNYKNIREVGAANTSSYNDASDKEDLFKKSLVELVELVVKDYEEYVRDTLDTSVSYEDIDQTVLSVIGDKLSYPSDLSAVENFLGKYNKDTLKDIYNSPNDKTPRSYGVSNSNISIFERSYRDAMTQLLDASDKTTPEGLIDDFKFYNGDLYDDKLLDQPRLKETLLNLSKMKQSIINAQKRARSHVSNSRLVNADTDNFIDLDDDFINLDDDFDIKDIDLDEDDIEDDVVHVTGEYLTLLSKKGNDFIERLQLLKEKIENVDTHQKYMEVMNELSQDYVLGSDPNTFAVRLQPKEFGNLGLLDNDVDLIEDDEELDDYVGIINQTIEAVKNDIDTLCQVVDNFWEEQMAYFAKSAATVEAHKTVIETQPDQFLNAHLQDKYAYFNIPGFDAPAPMLWKDADHLGYTDENVAHLPSDNMTNEQLSNFIQEAYKVILKIEDIIYSGGDAGTGPFLKLPDYIQKVNDLVLTNDGRAYITDDADNIIATKISLNLEVVKVS